MPEPTREAVAEPVGKPKYSWKFYTGIFLIVASLVIGKITQIIFFLYLDNFWLAWTSIIIYIISWPMIILGIWWVGKEYADKIRKYADYRFYHRSLREGTKRAIERTKQLHQKTRMIGDNVRNHLRKVKKLKKR